MSPLGVNSLRFWRVMFVSILLIFGFVLSSCASVASAISAPPTHTPVPPDEGNIVVSVFNTEGKSLTNDAVVWVTNLPQVDDNDNNEVRVGPCYSPNMLAIWASGYKTLFMPCPGEDAINYNVYLLPLDSQENANYPWSSAITCRDCHNGSYSAYNEYNEWRESGHSKVFSGRYFETMYRGIDMNGNQSPNTTWSVVDSHLLRNPPLLGVPYYGPGFKLDYPAENGNCAYCHAPASVNATMADVNLLPFFPNPGGPVGEGISCDVCHKVFGIELDQEGLPYSDRPGILSFQSKRPWDNVGFYTAPFVRSTSVDVAGNGITFHQTTCSPVFSQSEFCAACHYGEFFEMEIYNSYGEWMNSIFGKRMVDSGKATEKVENKDYRSCQDCHMPASIPIGETLPSERDACSAKNQNYFDFNHNVMNFGPDGKNPSEKIPQLIPRTASLNVETQYGEESKTFDVIVTVANERAGHKFPTDSPLRHLILVVEAKDERDTPLLQTGGDVIPNWGGVGDKANQNIKMKFYGGLPGKIFANVLFEEDTNITPTASYWVPLGQIEDTRLPPRNAPGDVSNSDVSNYSFKIPEIGNVNLVVSLMYRYAFIDLALQKGWARSDIEVVSVKCTVDPTRPETLSCLDASP